MFWIGLGVGLVVGGCVSVLIIALCTVAKAADRNM